jgi:putative flippase GtrA
VIERLLRLAGEHGAFIREASGYLVVSVAALALDLAAYWLLLASFASATVPAAIGYSTGLVLHYALASRLVFSSNRDGSGFAAEAPTFAKYAATGIAGIVMTSAIVGVCSNVLGWSALAAKLLATLCAFVAVFLARKFIVFGGVGRVSSASAA